MSVTKLCIGLAAACILSDAAKCTPQDWVEVRAGHAFTMKAPRGTVFRKERGEDSFVSGFDGPGFKMTFDFGIYSNPLCEGDRCAGEHTVIDGNEALIVSGTTRDGDFGCTKFVVAAHIKTRAIGFGGRPNSLMISACVSDKGKIPVVEQMFRSIHFNN